jgi:hypothetical protein
MITQAHCDRRIISSTEAQGNVLFAAFTAGANA